MWKLLSSFAHTGAATDVLAVCSPTVVTFHSSDGTAERAQNGPMLFKEVLSCFSETADKHHMPCSPSVCRGENWDFQLLLEPKSRGLSRPPPTSQEPKGSHKAGP